MTRRLGLIAVVVLLGATSAACGGSDVEVDDAGRMSVTLAQASTSMSQSPLYVARGLGYFEQVGLNVEVVSSESDSTAQAALDSGSADFVSSTAVSQLVAVSHRRPFRMLTTLSRDTYAYALRSDVARQRGYDPSLPLERRVQMLDGLTIGVASTGGASDLILRRLLQENGMDPNSDAEIVALGPETFTALRQGRIDAGMIAIPALAEATLDDVAVPLIPVYQGDAVPWLTGTPNMSIATTDDFAEENAEAVRRFNEALGMAMRTMREDPEAAQEALRQFFPEVDDSVFDWMWNELDVAWPQRPGMPRDDFDRLTNLADVLGQPQAAQVAYDEAVLREGA